MPTKTQMHTQNLFRLVTPKVALVSVIRDVFVIFGSQNLGDETKVTHGRSWQASIEPRKKPLTFHCTGCLIGVLIYNGLLKSPYNWVVCHPLYTLNKQGPFFHCSNGKTLKSVEVNGLTTSRRHLQKQISWCL